MLKRIFYLISIATFFPYIVNAKYGLDTAAKTAGLPVSNEKLDLLKVVSDMVSIVLSFVGVIFLILFIYGGFKWMFSKGDQNKITEAKGLLVNAVIGLVIIFSAYMITTFVMSSVINLTK